jgi:hypothetical protein
MSTHMHDYAIKTTLVQAQFDMCRGFGMHQTKFGRPTNGMLDLCYLPASMMPSEGSHYGVPAMVSPRHFYFFSGGKRGVMSWRSR